MGKEFLLRLFDETFEIAYGNSEQAIVFRAKILEKIEILKDKGIIEINDLDMEIQGLVKDKLLDFFIGSSNIFKEIYGLDEENKDEMITVLKDHSEVITGDFRDGNKEYNLLIAEKRMLLKEFEEKLNPKEKTAYFELDDLQANREVFILELTFEVMLTISEFLYNVERIKKTPEEVI